MINYIIMEFKLRNVTYPRYRKNKKNGYELSGYVNYDAWFLAGGVRVRNQFANKFPVATYMESGIDKLGFTLDRDFVNESNPLIYSLTNGGVSLANIGAYLHTFIHREYIDHKENVLDQVVDTFWNLFLEGIFKIPVKKVTLDVDQNPISEPIYFDYSFNDEKEVFNIIHSQIGFSNIELFFDYLFDILSLLNKSEYNIIEGSTYYSQDYKFYYANKSKRLSVLAAYDKAGQLERVKDELINYILHRFELRGQKKRISIMNNLNCLDGNYEKVFQNFAEPFAKQLRKLNNDFSKLNSVLPENDKLKELLDLVNSNNKTTLTTPTKEESVDKQSSDKKNEVDSEEDKVSENDILLLQFKKLIKSLKETKMNGRIKKVIFSCAINIARSVLNRSQLANLRAEIRGP